MQSISSYHVQLSSYSFIEINSTYGADASVLVQNNTESAHVQTTYMHCYKFQNTYRHHVLVGIFTSQ